MSLRRSDLPGLTRSELEQLAVDQALALDVIRRAADALGTDRLPKHRADLVSLIAQAAAGTLTPDQALAAWLDS